MSRLPRFVEFHEEGPREGFQIEKRVHPLEDRAKFVDALSESGLKWIVVSSFVSPKAVPSMADAEALFERIQKKPGVTYTGAYLNRHGFERLFRTPGAHAYGKLLLYTTDAFAIRNNNCTAEQMKRNQLEWLEIYDAHGLALEEAYILTAFGCNLGGDVPLSTVTGLVRFVVEICRDQGRALPRIVLADTAGWANPEDVKRRIHAVREAAPEARVGLHLHDTRGLGGGNFYAALEMGVDLFDSCVAGLGGCPFAAHKDSRAAGNICTEDMVFMCHEMGIETGIDVDKLIEAGRLAEEILGRSLPGRVMRSGTLAPYRKGTSVRDL